MVFVIGDLVCTVMILVGLVVILFLLLVPKMAEWRKGEGDRRTLLVVMVVLMVAMAGYTTWLVLDYREWTDTRELEYSLNVTAPPDAIGVLMVPVTVNKDLRDALEVSPGGSMELVDTENGEALRVVFQGNVTVRGHLVAREEFEAYDLTMEAQGHLPGTYRYWFHFDGDAATNGTVEIELELVHNSIYKYESFRAGVRLDEGWTERKVLWDHQEWYYG
ncbi:MAG: hypothetical protein JSW25_06670 [Thermoplasmata archaeon]|nr:MAG: hypothetical protein JSW25_06670 [Thermoplasmata archaeon]